MKDYVRLFLTAVGLLFIFYAFYSLLGILKPVQNPRLNTAIGSITSAFVSLAVAAGIFVYLRYIK